MIICYGYCGSSPIVVLINISWHRFHVFSGILKGAEGGCGVVGMAKNLSGRDFWNGLITDLCSNAQYTQKAWSSEQTLFVFNFGMSVEDGKRYLPPLPHAP